MASDPPDLLDLVRRRCRAVAEAATLVRVVPERIDPYAATLDVVPAPAPASSGPWDVDRTPTSTTAVRSDEARAALVIALDAVNFGSGYHPVVRKLPGRSGATTMATHLRTWAEAQDGGTIRADRLAGLDRADAHRIFDQPGTDELAELMGFFAASLRELGRFVADQHGGSFLALVASADGSARRLVATLAALPTWADVSRYGDLEVPFYKRAQITVADLHRAFAGAGPGAFADVDDLTAFADNLVPHVLRVDGVLRLDRDLERTIDRGELLVHGEPAEVELRACGVHAVELLRASAAARGHDLSAATIDQLLWSRGGGPRYKAIPRSRARTTAY